MAQEVRSFTVTIPAGTQIAAGFTADLSFPARQVQGLEILVPPGPRGVMGFAIGAAGVPVIPIQRGTYIVTDDDKIVWPLEGFWDSGSWTLFGYNTGRYPHSIEVRFLVAVPAQRSPVAQPITADQLTATFTQADTVPPPPAANGSTAAPLDLGSAQAVPALELPAASSGG